MTRNELSELPECVLCERLVRRAERGVISHMCFVETRLVDPREARRRAHRAQEPGEETERRER